MVVYSRNSSRASRSWIRNASRQGFPYWPPAAHIRRRAAEPGERHIIHPGKPAAESVEVDSGLASEGVHGPRRLQKREGFWVRPPSSRGPAAKLAH
jgi:hypothetical protein